MSNTLEGLQGEMPEALRPVTDRVVEAIAAERAVPAGDLRAVMAWLEEQDNALVPFGTEPRLYLCLEALGPWSDDDLRASEGLEETEEITDEQRVSFVQDQLRDDLNWGRIDCDIHPSFFTVSLESSSGREICLGVSVSGYSMTGVVTTVHGLFKDGEEFDAWLASNGFLAGPEALTDAMILECWEE